MKKNRLILLIILVFGFQLKTQAQILQPGFNPNEYSEFLRITVRQRGPINDSLYPAPLKFVLNYDSKSMGMDNGWQLWTSKPSNPKKSAVISIRATTAKHSSWAENLYSTMVSANGSIQLENNFTFNYQMAQENSRATVHVGWLIGTAYLQRDILPKIDSLYKKGTKDFFIFGHSQGGAISYMLTAYFHYLKENGKLPKDINFKTYSSASPKPGNLFFAYDYESYTRNNWAFNVVNTQDWVPETPLSMQTPKNFSNSSPLNNFNSGTSSLPFMTRMVVRSKYNSLISRMTKSSEKYNKIMGKQFREIIKIFLPEYKAELEYKGNNYQRCGSQITLMATDEYFKFFPNQRNDPFRNHMMDAYQILLELYYGEQMDKEYIIYTNHTFPFYLKPKIPADKNP